MPVFFPRSTIVSALSAAEVFEYITPFKESTLIFFDVDDTLITPQSKTFKSAPYNKMMDRIKSNKEQFPNFKEILSNWRLQRSVMLVDNEWPKIINLLKKPYPVYGLTKINTGKFGNIKSVEEWRHQELLSLGIEFSQSNQFLNDNRIKRPDTPTYHNGIFITGSFNKRQTLQLFWKNIPTPKNIIFIDDKKTYLEEVKQFCKERGCNFLGIHFKGVSTLAITPDPKLAAFQEKHLIEYAEWLEDDAAYVAMKKLETP